MNNIIYDLIIKTKLPAAAPKEIRYRVRKEVKNHVIKYISTPIIEEESDRAYRHAKELEPTYTFYR
jgi:hypothetical protein